MNKMKYIVLIVVSLSLGTFESAFGAGGSTSKPLTQEEVNKICPVGKHCTPKTSSSPDSCFECFPDVCC